MIKKEETEKMRVSFDLDEVLFVSPVTHKTEKQPLFPLNLIFKERLRLGAPELIRRLQEEGCDVWIYTSSFRSEKYIRNLFRLYGVHFQGVVNGQRHMKEVQARHRDPLPNKLPCYYRISLHIDDESIVMTHGKTYGFNVFQLNAQDDDWAEKVMERVYEIKKKGHQGAI